MSIQSQIDRIVQGKQDIIAAITAKGVTVPADASIDDLAALVQAIENASDPVLQSKTVTPTTAKQTVKPDSGYDGLSDVTVNAMPAATQATPSISVSSAGLITASATQSAGYVSAGTKSATKQLTTQAAKTVTPSTSSQTAVARGIYTTGAVTVAAIPSTYVKPTTTKAATTYTPTTSNQTIASGTYCSGVQTIKGDSNLVAGNIKSGVSIFGVTGSYEGGGGASVETCTVSISGASNGGLCIITQLVDGEITVNTFQQDGIKEDVVCGSGLYLRGFYLSCSVSAGEVLYCGNGFYYQVPKIKGATVNITLIPD